MKEATLAPADRPTRRDGAENSLDLAGASPPSPAAPDGRKAAPYTTEPAAIAASYYVEDRGAERRYFEDYRRESLAMTATATRIATRREDLRTVRDMVVIAESRGWRSLDVGGTEAFRREAWIEATARGLDARGYEPTDPDRQEADRRRAALPASDVPPARGQAAAPARTAELSPDGRLLLAAISDKIDRQMDRFATDVRSELKAFVAGELAKKERAQGPVALSPDQRRQATTAEPAPPVRRLEPEEPRLSRGR